LHASASRKSLTDGTFLKYHPTNRQKGAVDDYPFNS
jgi:hypothetical protein